MAFEIITIPFNPVQGHFDPDILRDVTINKKILKWQAQFFQSEGKAYWTLFMEYDPLLKDKPHMALSEAQQHLYTKLAEWRKSRAEKDGLPLFIIATNKDLEIIVKEANRCKLITRSLLDFARQTEPRRVPVNINQLIKETVALVKNQASFQNIKIIEDLNSALPLVMVDPNQIEQVFMNIILNAQEAMPQGGFLSISSDFSEDGRSVEIKFTDTGCGIPKEHMGKLFDPFFTTKETGRGTGLGLAISYGLIKKHRGDIEIESQEGKGTTVTIKLPVKE